MLSHENHTDPIPLLPWAPCRTVLCWVGHVDSPDPVVQVACRLAQAGNGTCSVVLALDPALTWKCKTCLRYSGQGPLTPAIIDRASQALTRLYGQSIPTVVLPGNPLHEIRRYARRHRADLIVMGEQAWALEKDYGEHLAEQAPCTVLIIMPKHGGEHADRPAVPTNEEER